MQRALVPQNIFMKSLILILTTVGLVSCGSSQYTSSEDGIYSSGDEVAENEYNSATRSGYYSSYFNQGAEQLNQANSEGTIFTDIDSYSSASGYAEDEQMFQEGDTLYNPNAGWGDTYDRTIVNVYPSYNWGFPYYGFGNYWGYGYNYGFNRWGYAYGYGNPYFYGGLGGFYGGFGGFYGGYGYPYFGGFGYAYNPYFGYPYYYGYGYRNYYNNYYNNYNNRYSYSNTRRDNYRSATANNRSNQQANYRRTERTYSRNNVGVNTSRLSRSNNSAAVRRNDNSNRSIYNSTAAQRRSSGNVNTYSRSANSTNSAVRRSNNSTYSRSNNSYSRSTPARSHGLSPGGRARIPHRASTPFIAQASSCMRLSRERQVTDSDIDGTSPTRTVCGTLNGT